MKYIFRILLIIFGIPLLIIGTLLFPLSTIIGYIIYGDMSGCFWYLEVLKELNKTIDSL